MREIYAFFQADGGEKKALLVFAFSQLPSVQNNLYAKVVYLGVAYSDALHT